MHTITSLGNKITSREIDIFVNNFLEKGIIDEKEAMLIKSATNDKVLTIENPTKDEIRAKILKNMLIALVQKHIY